MAETTQPRLTALTSARFFAAFYVLLFHMVAMRGLMWAPRWWQTFAGAGFVAVTFFFVLSGFILVYTYAGKSFDLRRFWRARLARLYPVYLLSLLVSAPLFFYALTHFDIPVFEWAKAHLGATVVLVLAMLQAWVPGTAMAWNGVAWAVSVEIFFYVLFPLLLRRFGRLSNRALAIVCVVSWAAALTLADVYVLRTPDYFEADPDQSGFWLNALKFNPLVRLPEFMIGVACGFWFQRGNHNPRLGTPLVLGGTAAALVTTAFSPLIPYPVMHTGLYAPAFAAIICGLALRPRWSSFLEARWLVLLGEASYCLYMFHTLFLGAFIYMATVLGPLPFRLVAGTATALVVAVLIFRYVEEPARRRLRGRPQKTVAAVVSP
ncbi:MAG: acyltransferase [Acidobacteriia bacterium]|nr:acyltransferase [Terriglobia bacterium]